MKYVKLYSHQIGDLNLYIDLTNIDKPNDVNRIKILIEREREIYQLIQNEGI